MDVLYEKQNLFTMDKNSFYYFFFKSRVKGRVFCFSYKTSIAYFYHVIMGEEEYAV